MKLKIVSAAAALVFAATGAQAAVYDLGVHDLLEASFALAGAPSAGTVAPGSFVDLYVFGLLETLKVTSTVASINQAPFVGIVDGSYYILSAGVDNDLGTDADNFIVANSLHSFDGTTGSTPHSVNLGAGVYVYAVTGTATGAFGRYQMLSSVSAVPEPETWGLMLAGIGLLGFLAKRRQV